MDSDQWMDAIDGAWRGMSRLHSGLAGSLLTVTRNNPSLGDRKSLTTSVCRALCGVGHTSSQCPGQECDLHSDVWSLALRDGQAAAGGCWGWGVGLVRKPG